MKTKFIFERFLSLFLILCIFTLSVDTIAQSEETIVSIVDKEGNHEGISYKSIKMSDLPETDNLIKVYINSSSIILLNGNIAKQDNVKGKLKEIIKNNLGDVNQNNIEVKKNKLIILIRKSTNTNKDDYSKLFKSVNHAIWDMMEHYSKKVYSKEYSQLIEMEKNEIDKLVPLNNLQAEDVEL